MTELLSGPAALVGLAVAAFTLASLIGLAVRKGYRGFRALVHLFDDLAGEEARPGVPARPGLMERMARTEDTAAEVKVALGRTQADWDAFAGEVRVSLTELELRTQELKPNGGGSIKDKIDSLDRRVHSIEIHNHPQ